MHCFYLQLLTCLGVTAGGISALIYALDNSVRASDLIAHAPTYKWDFYGWFNSLDHARYDFLALNISRKIQEKNSY